MKKSKKLKIWGFSQLFVGALLIFLGIVIKDDNGFDLGWSPNFIYFVPGMFIALFSLPIIIIGFGPEIAKFSSNLQSETIDYAKDDIKESIAKRSETIIPAVTPAIKEAVSSIKDKNLEEQLKEATKLYEKDIITKEEYEQLRK